MTLELFLGSLIALTLAAIIIVLMTTQKRVNYSDDDLERRKGADRKMPGSDQNR